MTQGLPWRPLLALVELTLRCNLRCRHCGSSAGGPRRDELSAVELEQVVDDVAELGGEDLVLLGGEPLLSAHWERLCLRARERGLTPVLITNGLLVDERVARRVEAAGVGRVGVSLDGATPAVHDALRGVEGSHRRAWEALDRLRSRGVVCSVITTVSRANFSELAAMRDQLLGSGLGWQLQTASPGGARFDPAQMLSREEFWRLAAFIADCRARYSLAELPVAGAHDVGYHSGRLKNYAQSPHWHGCLGGLTTVGVQSDGVIKPCLSLPESFAEGSVRDRGLKAVWRDPERFARNRRFRPELLEGGCRDCEHAESCRGGCLELGFRVTGSQYQDPYCLLQIEREGRAPAGPCAD